jgi:hypothetical protein
MIKKILIFAILPKNTAIIMIVVFCCVVFTACALTEKEQEEMPTKDETIELTREKEPDTVTGDEPLSLEPLSPEPFSPEPLSQEPLPLEPFNELSLYMPFYNELKTPMDAVIEFMALCLLMEQYPCDDIASALTEICNGKNYVWENVWQNKWDYDAVYNYIMDMEWDAALTVEETIDGISTVLTIYGKNGNKEYTAIFELQEEGVNWRIVSVSYRPEIFGNYTQAYIDKIIKLENEYEGLEYSLIYFDEDDIPELAAGVTGYYISMYTFHSGELYTVMDMWPYGAFGNHGYDYIPKRNVLRNYDADFAGLLLWEFYGKIDENYEIQSYYDKSLSIWMFNDKNGNYMPDEGEYDDTREYFYYGEQEITPEEYNVYLIQGDYEFLCGIESASEIIRQLESR